MRSCVNSQVLSCSSSASFSCAERMVKFRREADRRANSGRAGSTGRLIAASLEPIESKYENGYLVVEVTAE